MFLLICVFFLYSALKKSKKPLRTLISSAVLGIGTLLLLNLTSSVTGVDVGLNAVSVSVSALLGFPGAVLVFISGLI